MSIYEKDLEYYKKLNKFAVGDCVVLFGSSFAKDIPLCELKQSCHLDADLYNRSFSDLSVFDAKELLKDCVLSLFPKKILLNLGETDLERGYRTIPEIVDAYEEIINEIKNFDKNCGIVLISVCNNTTELYPDELNRRLEELAAKTKCRFADISPAFSYDMPSVKAFGLLKFFMRDRMSLSDVMSAAAIS